MKIAIVPFLILSLLFAALFGWAWHAFSATVVAHGGEAIPAIEMLIIVVVCALAPSLIIAGLIERQREKRRKNAP